VKRVTLDEMYDELELYGFEDFEDSQKLLLLNEAYLDVVTREPWPFLEKVLEFKVLSGTTQITSGGSFWINPDTNTHVINPTPVQITNSPGTPLVQYEVNSVLSFVDVSNDMIMTPERADVLEKNYRILDPTGTPRHYYFVGDDMFVYPAVFLIPARHHSIIVYGALVKAFLVNDDPQAGVFQNAFESRYQQMRNDVWMNQYDRTDRIHVLSDSYDWSY
jgi:hypothetical protein